MKVPFARKIAFAAFSILLSSLSFAAGKASSFTAAQLREKALRQDSVQEGISFIQEHLEECASPADKRSSLHFLGTLQEQ